MHYKLQAAKKKKVNEERIKIPSTVAGYIILVTGLAVLLKGVWLTNPAYIGTWGIILAVGMLLTIIGTVTIAYRV